MIYGCLSVREGGNFSRLDIQKIFTEMVSLKNSEYLVYKELFERILLREIFILGFDNSHGMTIFGSQKPDLKS